MSYLARYQLGQTVFLLCNTTNAQGTAVVPDDVPTLKVFAPNGTIVLAREMPVRERFQVDGLFQYPLLLTSDFTTGQYRIVYYWKAAAYHGVAEDGFSVIEGGNSDGAVTSMYFYRRPHADFLVQALETGRIVKGRNPQV